jgi:hypothetical protein
MRYGVTLTAITLTLFVAVPAIAQDSGFGAGRPEDRYFRIESAVAPGRHGEEIQGYVYNVYDAHAVRVLVSIEALDASGRVLETRNAYVPFDVPARGRSFFSVPAPAGAASARVRVLSFEWTGRGAGGSGGGGM